MDPRIQALADSYQSATVQTESTAASATETKVEPSIPVYLPQRRRRPTEERVRVEMVRLIDEAPRSSSELLGCLEGFLSIDKCRYVAIRKSLEREGLIQNVGDPHLHRWVPSPQYTPKLPVLLGRTAESAADTEPSLTYTPLAKAVTPASAASADGSLMQVIAEQTLEIRRLRRLMNESSELDGADGMGHVR